ncbi:50S ribosomal protein L22 [Candidatus Micrarchaeota archaeon CG_4_10_14_0_2_um_filter_60_11]|nr:MAG: 50S ribosomal protein L22 [Candidatus Micrarchaeota archaeon CG10_big_fil_rev_8_21_14_0_10_60_32]PIO01867.1 MAG: 50S ribosomal protein L22 [Candidatus Micrarchaeota archaeon CG09_land_8_20_14_0_10_60_16]PIY91533.1 MAG: 50S ribosomal protein L22 [Candidatus Micrarchaeota archaeon CG_4_10_14_0_8_um_filter_60_7]PIZ90852.1 MAG: 50S ribosomal protein L22 [Candidatus Micrarchaeota archaeon CG_4_10_14_0_2_um_filter_60_11]
MYKYSFKKDEKAGCAQGHDWKGSYKDLTNICSSVKGKNVKKAYEILDGAIALEKAIPYRNHNTGCGHRSELGGKKGRYPRKECVLFKKLLQNAVANAVNKGLDESKLFVSAARAYKQNDFPRYRRFFVSSATLGYGKRAVWANYVTSRTEIEVKERDESVKKRNTKEAKAEARKAKKAKGV